MGKNHLQNARFFPPKDLVYFWLTTRHHSKAQTFFPKENFPAKKLSFFFSKFFSDPFKSAFVCAQKIFPAKRLSFFFEIFPPDPFKSAFVCAQKIFPAKRLRIFSKFFPRLLLKTSVLPRPETFLREKNFVFYSFSYVAAVKSKPQIFL